MLFSRVCRRLWLPLLVAVPIFAVAAVSRLVFLSALGNRVPYVTFFPAVMLAVLFGGVPAGYIVTTLSALLVTSRLMVPFGTRDQADWIGLAVFLLSCGMVSWLSELTRRAQVRASEAEGQAKLAEERQRAGAALSESDAKFRSYVENAPFAVLAVDRDGHYVDFNPAACALLGYRGGTLAKMHILEVHPLEEHAAVMRDFETLFEKGRLDVETRLLKADGQMAWVALRAVRVNDTLAFAYCHDITDQRKAERDMGERLALREQLATIAATVPGVIHSFRLRPDGSCCFPYASPSLEQIFGLHPADVVEDAKAAIRLIHGDDLERVRRTMEESARNLTPWRDEFRVNHPRRGQIWVEGHSVPQREADGSVLWQGFTQDITARKLSEEALRDASQFNRQIIDSADEGIIVYGPDLRYQVWNPFMERYSGRPASEVLGRHPLEVFPLLGEAGVVDMLAQVLHGEVRCSLDFAFHSRVEGRICWASDSNAPLRNAKGEVIGVIGTVRDITDRKLMEEELRGSETRFRTLVEQAAEANRRLELAMTSGGFGVWDLDVQANTLVWNDQMYELYGVDRNGFDGNRQTWSRNLHPSDRDRVLAAADAAVAGTRDFDMEFRIVTPGGKVKTLKANAVVVRDEQGRAVRMIGLNRDITEQRSLELQLAQAQKMEAVGRLAGGVAHDFNNNLTVILGYAELSKLVALSGEQIPDYLDEIIRAAEHSREITKQLLAFSRNEIIAPRRVDLNQLIRQTDKTLSRLIGEDVRLSLTTPEGVWPMLIDPAQLNQIIVNLAVNARDAMPAGGVLSIETGNVRIDEICCLGNPDAKPGDYVKLAIGDTGVGMDRETLGHIFEPFYTTKGIGKGTGLGLATVYGIVRQNDGFITVQSEPGQGALFALFFPRLAGESAAELAPARRLVTGEGTVLLVEDEESVRHMARLMLEKAGFSVLVAQSAVEALEISGRLEIGIQCLLTDVIMPGMNGVELSLAVRKLRPEVGVAFMSGYTDDMIARHGVLADGVIFIQKPFDMNSLSEKVKKAIRLSGKAVSC